MQSGTFATMLQPRYAWRTLAHQADHEQRIRQAFTFAFAVRSGHSKQISTKCPCNARCATAQFVCVDAIGALHINRYYGRMLATSPVIRTNGAMQIVASHFSFREIATMLRRWSARPLRSVSSNATRLILPLLAVIRTKCDGL